MREMFDTIFASSSLSTAFVGLSAIGILRLAMKIDPRPAQRQRCRRLIADCDYQNAAFIAGDEVTATYGRYRP